MASNSILPRRRRPSRHGHHAFGTHPMELINRLFAILSNPESLYSLLTTPPSSRAATSTDLRSSPMEPPSISKVLHKTTQPLHVPDMTGLNSLMGRHSDSIRAPSPNPRDAALDSCSDFPPLLTVNRSSKCIAPPPISSISVQAPSPTPCDATVDSCSDFPPLLTANRPFKRIAPPPISSITGNFRHLDLGSSISLGPDEKTDYAGADNVAGFFAYSGSKNIEIPVLNNTNVLIGVGSAILMLNKSDALVCAGSDSVAISGLDNSNVMLSGLPYFAAPGRTDLGASEGQAHANIPPHGLELNKQQVAVFMQPPGSVLNDAQLQQMAVANQLGPGNSEFSRPYMDALAPRKTNIGSCCYFWD